MVGEKIKTELNRLKNLKILINKITDKDGQVTQDEQSLLDSIEKDLQEYQKMLNEYLDKENISQKDLDLLKNFKIEIFENARNIAANDGKFKEEEWHLLEKLDIFVQKGI